ncbi:MAG: hypothetical protein KF690_08950 [Bacteroidetes bacterium]|nr:hypothetical protein [Bacteroidota bacterium]
MEQIADWAPDKVTNARWDKLSQILEDRFGQRMRLEAILLLIGIQEVGIETDRELEKHEKMNLMHVGLCTVLEPAGYYTRTQPDADGWPHWELAKPIPYLDLFKQVNFLRYWLVQYFMKIYHELESI